LRGFFCLSNSLIWGYKKDEIAIDKSDKAPFLITNSTYNLLKTQDELALFQGNQNLFNLDPLFKNTAEGDYHLEEKSNAINQIPKLSLPIDLEGNSRSNPTDIGAYEFQ